MESTKPQHSEELTLTTKQMNNENQQQMEVPQGGQMATYAGTGGQMAPNTQWSGAPAQAPQSSPPGLVGSTQMVPMGTRDTQSYNPREGTSQMGFPNHLPMDEDSNMESQPHRAESSSRKQRQANSVGPWEFTAQCDVLHQSGCSICDDYQSHRMWAEACKNLDFKAAIAEQNQWQV